MKSTTGLLHGHFRRKGTATVYIGGDLKLEVNTNLQKILDDHHKYVSVFKSALERLQNKTDMKIVIRPDKKPTMELPPRPI
jgi:hypothetical protein